MGTDQYERAAEDLERKYAAGLIDNASYWQRLREICRDLTGNDEEEARDAFYNSANRSPPPNPTRPHGETGWSNRGNEDGERDHQ